MDGDVTGGRPAMDVQGGGGGVIPAGVQVTTASAGTAVSGGGGTSMQSAAPARSSVTWANIAVVNDKSSGVSDADAMAMMKAVEQQVLYDFGPIWHMGARFTFVPAGGKPPAGKWCVALLGSSDQAGALGYHDLTPDGLPLGKVFAGTDRQYGQNVCVTLSHEVLEMLGDPWIDLCAQGPDGKFYAWEASDAVEADELGYKVLGQTVSAFVTPAWFGHGAGPLTYPEGLVQRPLQLASGGYISVFDPASGQGWAQVQDRTAPDHTRTVAEVQAKDAAAIPRVGSRRERRFRGRANWISSVYETV